VSDPAADRVTSNNVSALKIEENGINVIGEEERGGEPRSLFWPWFGANVSVLGLSYGAFVLDDGISFAQAVFVSVIGILISFLLCGLISLAGKRASAPTMILSRAAYGVRGSRLPAGISWLLCVGWETFLSTLAVLATSAIFTKLGWGGGDAVKIVAMIIVAALIIGGGVMGFTLIMRMQTVITVVTAVLTIAFIALTMKDVSWHTVSHIHSGSFEATIGALVFVMTGFGLGWVNVAADYSRYLPRSTSSRGVVWWTTLGGSIAPLILVIYGLLLAGSSATLSNAVSELDPIGALATASKLPTWFLVPFIIVAVLGIVGGAVLDIYSSGLALLSAGLKIPRYAAAGVDGVIMLLGTIYLVFAKQDFLGQFEGFLITVGVLIAAWCGVFLGDLALRRENYNEIDLFRPTGRYGDFRPVPILITIASSVLGLGLVTNTTASWLTWQGYLLGPFGLGGKTGAWEYANLGVLFALVVSFLLTVLFTRTQVVREEALA
jgi:purine-cytosine permease-like protein